MEPRARGYNWTTLFLGDINTGTWPSRLGESHKAVSSAGLGPESDCSGKTQKQLYSKLQTHTLVREGAPQQEICNCQTENKSLVKGFRWGPTPRQTGRLTVDRKVTLTSTSTSILNVLYWTIAVPDMYLSLRYRGRNSVPEDNHFAVFGL
jgi:hypothetical protein